MRFKKKSGGKTTRLFLFLEKANRLLENRAFKNAKKVVAEVGYGDVRHFSRRFKKRFGRVPSEYLSP